MTDRRTVIADAAITTLAREGMRGFTHRAVDRTAGLAEGSTSYYFRTREALMSAALARLAELDTLDIGDLPGPPKTTDPTSLTSPTGTTGPVGPASPDVAANSTGSTSPAASADTSNPATPRSPAGSAPAGSPGTPDSAHPGDLTGSAGPAAGPSAEAHPRDLAGSASPAPSTSPADPTVPSTPAGAGDPDPTNQPNASSGASVDALATLMSSLVWRWLTDARERTLARYELTLESTRRPEVRAKLRTHGAAFRVTAEQTLTGLGASEPRRRAATLVAYLDGLLLHQLTRVAPSELDRRELDAACRDLLGLALA